MSPSRRGWKGPHHSEYTDSIIQAILKQSALAHMAPLGKSLANSAVILLLAVLVHVDSPSCKL